MQGNSEQPDKEGYRVPPNHPSWGGLPQGEMTRMMFQKLKMLV